MQEKKLSAHDPKHTKSSVNHCEGAHASETDSLISNDYITYDHNSRMNL